MPCFTRYNYTVDIGEGLDPGILSEALESLGFVFMYERNGERFYQGNATHRGTVKVTAGGGLEAVRARTRSLATEESVNEFKRAYADATLKRAAKRYGWVLQKTPATGDYTMRRR